MRAQLGGIQLRAKTLEVCASSFQASGLQESNIKVCAVGKWQLGDKSYPVSVHITLPINHAMVPDVNGPLKLTLVDGRE